VNPKLLSLHGLKWNPFSPDVPTEALLVTPQLEHFGWRVEHLAREGGFALITGEPGLGKSVALRLLAERLSTHRDLALGILTRPQSGIPDFYRELGDLFGVQLSPHNRWAGARVLREPKAVAGEIATFLGIPLDIEAMVRQVDGSLYRNRMK